MKKKRTGAVEVEAFLKLLLMIPEDPAEPFDLWRGLWPPLLFSGFSPGDESEEDRW